MWFRNISKILKESKGFRKIFLKSRIDPNRFREISVKTPINLWRFRHSRKIPKDSKQEWARIRWIIYPSILKVPAEITWMFSLCPCPLVPSSFILFRIEISSSIAWWIRENYSMVFIGEILQIFIIIDVDYLAVKSGNPWSTPFDYK